jgi:uncharacterized protein
MRRLTLPQARRVAIGAQGLASPRPASTPNLGHVRRTIRSLGLLQIDSVNVVERAHNLTLFSRLGPYDTDLLWRALEERRIFEFWARMASFCPIEDHPLYRYKMDAYAEGNWNRVKELNSKAPEYVEAVFRELAENGPLTASELSEPGERNGPWWGWADGKVALEYLFAAGRVAVAYRRNFTRYYDIAERVIPSDIFNQPAIPAEEAKKRLILQAAKALGVGTAGDIINYYSIRIDQGKPVLANLVSEGELIEVEVEGWTEPAYLDAEAVVPRSVDARTLVNPFDTYMWNRDRIERFHGFHYRIEIYVPKPKRVYGYYVLPFLLGEHLVARVDLKADRKSGTLLVPGAFLEEGADPGLVSRELAVELGEMARWLDLGEIAVGKRGDLAPHLRRMV